MTTTKPAKPWRIALTTQRGVMTLDYRTPAEAYRQARQELADIEAERSLAEGIRVLCWTNGDWELRERLYPKEPK